MALEVTTTGTLDPVVINDLGGRSLAHPTVSLDLEDFYASEELKKSVDLYTAIGAGDLTAVDSAGRTITTAGDYLRGFETIVTDATQQSSVIDDTISSSTSQTPVLKLQKAGYLAEATGNYQITANWAFTGTNKLAIVFSQVVLENVTDVTSTTILDASYSLDADSVGVYQYRTAGRLVSLTAGKTYNLNLNYYINNL